jgi:hypothetical protein
MATNTFYGVLQGNTNAAQTQQNAQNWLQEQAANVRNPRQLIDGNTRLVSRIAIGRMYLFYYDPKTKDQLPYYDKFPLIFPFQRVDGGFYGLNLHYLPHILRARLMDSLLDLANNKVYDDTTKLKISYQILSSSSKFKYFEPCVKHYLNSHVRSRFLWIPAEQWNTALFLPLERFQKRRKETVWRNSRDMVK